MDKSSLPIITQSSNRNNQITLNALNTSTISGDGDDEYEQDFEQEEKKLAAL